MILFRAAPCWRNFVAWPSTLKHSRCSLFELGDIVFTLSSCVHFVKTSGQPSFSFWAQTCYLPNIVCTRVSQPALLTSSYLKYYSCFYLVVTLTKSAFTNGHNASFHDLWRIVQHCAVFKLLFPSFLSFCRGLIHSGFFYWCISFCWYSVHHQTRHLLFSQIICSKKIANCVFVLYLRPSTVPVCVNMDLHLPFLLFNHSWLFVLTYAK